MVFIQVVFNFTEQGKTLTECTYASHYSPAVLASERLRYVHIILILGLHVLDRVEEGLLLLHHDLFLRELLGGFDCLFSLLWLLDPHDFLPFGRPGLPRTLLAIPRLKVMSMRLVLNTHVPCQIEL